jgi:RNA polymerase sigma-70 factor (ECF subfamily)
MEDVQVQHNGRHHRIADASVPAICPTDDRQVWLAPLRGTGPPHDEAVAALYELLVGAARLEIRRRWAGLGYGDDDALDELATLAADDALLALLAKLDDYRGDSRFRTWASKFAILEAGIRARRRAWHHRDVVLDCEGCSRLADPVELLASSPEHVELLEAVADGIDAVLTRHQRRVLVALAIDRVPIDVLAERLNTTRGALYETLHDARRELRRVLDERGVAFDEA